MAVLNCPSARTLLYVEDDADARQLFETTCEQAKTQFQTRFASTVEEALDYLTCRGNFDDPHKFPSPNLILLDYNLGGSTGLKVLSWMRQRPQWRHTAVSIFSACDQPDDIAKAYDAGAHYYLVKPDEYTRLVELVRQIDRAFHSNSRHGLHRLVTLAEYRPRLSAARPDSWR